MSDKKIELTEEERFNRKREKMKNVPNALSLLRMALVPVFVFFYLADFIPHGKLTALVIFCIASFTDFLDGYIARKYKVISEFGKFMDSIADKLLTTSAFVLIVADGSILAPLGAIILILTIGRDFIMNGLRQVGAMNNIAIAADKMGKWKAFAQMVALPLFMFLSYEKDFAFLTDAARNVVSIVSYSILGIAVALTVLSLINYLIKNKKVLKNNNLEKVGKKDEK